MRALTAARALFGSALLIAPGTLLANLPHEGGIDGRARAFARILGARQLVEAALVGRRGSRAWILAGAAVDGTHAATMVVLAAVDERRRALALTNALTAAAIALAGVHEARRV